MKLLIFIMIYSGVTKYNKTTADVIEYATYTRIENTKSYDNLLELGFMHKTLTRAQRKHSLFTKQ